MGWVSEETYREAVEAVTVADVQRVAQEHLRPERAAVVLLGDHDAFSAALDELDLGPVDVVRDAEHVQTAEG